MAIKCRECRFRRKIPGDAHISCANPAMTEGANAIKVSVLVLAGQGEELRPLLGFGFNDHGVKSGWCNFPLNFDPIWLDGDKCELLQMSDDADNLNFEAEASE